MPGQDGTSPKEEWANAFWPHEEWSVEEAAYETVNGSSGEYREMWARELIKRVKAQCGVAV